MTAIGLPICRIVRRVAGQSNAHLVAAEDGLFYIAKFSNNAKSNRTLVNEWVGSRLLRACEICAPRVQVLELPVSVLRDAERLYVSTDNGSPPIEAGLHLGSQCPVDPTKVGIFGWLPTRLLEQVVNLEDFTRVCVVDYLLGQRQARQAVFAREQTMSSDRFRAWMIGQATLFGGPEWRIRYATEHLLYRHRAVYSQAQFSSILDSLLCRLASADAEIERAFAEIPSCWLASTDHFALNSLRARIIMRLCKAYEMTSIHKNALSELLDFAVM